VPAQWLMFEDMWGAPPASGRVADEMVTPPSRPTRSSPTLSGSA